MREMSTERGRRRNHIKQGFLQGEKLYLRPFVARDLTDDYLAWLHDPEVNRYLQTGRFPVTKADLKEYFERFKHGKENLLFAIVDRKTDQHIGNVTLNHIDWTHRTADTGLVIGRKEFWGKGYAYEAWFLVIGYALRRLGLRKLIAGAVERNKSSVEVLKKLGFRVEGTLRQEFYLDGEYLDVLRFGLLAEEFASAADPRG